MALRAALFLAGTLVPAATGITDLLRISVLARAETRRSKSSLDESMHRHYDTAFRLQVAGRVTEADAEHKLFLAEALRHVGNGRANIGEYALSVPVYEEAIQFAPKDFTLHLEYAEAALDADDPAKAKLLAQEALALLPPAADQKRAKTMHVLANSRSTNTRLRLRWIQVSQTSMRSERLISHLGTKSLRPGSSPR
jgi:tetratricopeptide (TPR) repeat protein